MNQRSTWRRFIVVLLVCTSMACGAQILPQLIAQVASLDHDHAVSLHARNDGVDLVLTHDAHTLRAKNEGQSIALSTSQRAHVIHIITGPATAKQSGSLGVINAQYVVAYFSSIITTKWRIFVPPPPLDYSRPPPGEVSILPLHRSPLLLI